MEQDGTRPNVVLLVADTARARNLSLYGYDRRTSPFLEEMAQNAVVYNNAISTAPWTLPAHASMFTGLYTSGHELTRSSLSLREDLRILPEILSQNGYRTYSITANVGMANIETLNAGFDETYITTRMFPSDTDYTYIKESFSEKGTSIGFGKDLIGFTTGPGSLRDVANLGYKFTVGHLGESLLEPRQNSPKGTRQNIDLFKNVVKESKEPFFAFLNFMETHLDYIPERTYLREVAPAAHADREFDSVNQDPRLHNYVDEADMSSDDFELLESFYDGAVRQTDAAIAGIYQTLEQAGKLRNTLFIVVGDHGENIGDFNRIGHSLALNDALLRVPLIVSYPGTAASTNIDQLVQIHDLFPTILDVCDREMIPSSQDKLGSDAQLLPRSPSDAGRKYAVAEYLGSPFTGIESLMKRFPEHDYTQHDYEIKTIYDDEDRKFTIYSTGEKRLSAVGIAGEETMSIDNEVGKRLEDQLFETIQPFGSVGFQGSVDKSTQDTLRSLGYI